MNHKIVQADSEYRAGNILVVMERVLYGKGESSGRF